MASPKRPYFKSLAIILILLAIIIPTISAARTQFGPDCNVYGDSDVYGLGIRLSLYLQWFGTIILHLFSPADADITRKSTVVIILALYINEYQSMASGSLIALEWSILWFLTFSLSILNLPVSSNGFKKNGATISLMLVLCAAYYVISPWVFFRWLDNGRSDGCDLKMFIFTPVSMYSHGFRVAFKILSVMNAVILLPIALSVAFIALKKWFQNWHNQEVRGFEEEPNPKSAVLALLQIVGGCIAIGFLEKSLSLNKVSFPGASISDSGQLIPLLIGIFALVSAVFAAIRTLTK